MEKQKKPVTMLPTSTGTTHNKVKENIVQHNVIYTKKIVEEMLKHNPVTTDAKIAKIEAIANEWVNKCRKWCLFNSYWDNGNLYLPTYSLRANFTHRYRKDGKMQHWFYFLADNFPMWTTITKGFKGKYSKASEVMLLNNKQKKMTVLDRIEMLEEIGAEGYYEENLAKLQQQVKNNPKAKIIEQQIDVENLAIYVKDTKRALAEETLEEAFRDTLLRNLEHALKVLCCLKDNILPVLETAHNFGRDFHGGINIQGAHRELRKAALGSCISVDVEASVFGYYLQQLSELHTINPTTDTANSLQILELMLKDRSAFRNAIAYDCFSHLNITEEEKIKIVKQALTALGFGAKTGNFFFDQAKKEFRDSIPNIIKEKQARDNFLNHPAVILLEKAFQILIDDVRTNYKTIESFKTVVDNIPEIKENKRINFKQVLAFLYQKYEANVRKTMIKEIGAENVLLQTHDGLYVKNDSIIDVEYEIQQINPYAKIEIDYIKGYAYKPAIKLTKKNAF